MTLGGYFCHEVMIPLLESFFYCYIKNSKLLPVVPQHFLDLRQRLLAELLVIRIDHESSIIAATTLLINKSTLEL